MKLFGFQGGAEVAKEAIGKPAGQAKAPTCKESQFQLKVRCLHGETFQEKVAKEGPEEKGVFLDSTKWCWEKSESFDQNGKYLYNGTLGQLKRVGAGALLCLPFCAS